jgi:hypothetical protein
LTLKRIREENQSNAAWPQNGARIFSEKAIRAPEMIWRPTARALAFERTPDRIGFEEESVSI